MYNEPAAELKRTLLGIAENMDDLEAESLSWREVVISIVVDGRMKANPDLLGYVEKELKLYDANLIVDEYHGKPVSMHTFERTVRLPKFTSQKQYYKPMQLIFALKEKNGGKLNSHLWFFTGFCRQLQPKYTFLLDVGTQPRPKAISKLYHAMEDNAQIGGCCGEIAVKDPKVYNLLESAQHFEYKVSHVLDKAMESVFGYISVLPGAFSAYRYEAIVGTPLSHYFFVEENSVRDMGPFMANMYLAEDRVLCFELVAKKDKDWVLHYEAGAVADTDVPTTILELIKQRRRWLNGAFFSLVYYIIYFRRITTESAHSWPRKFILWIQFLYQLSSLVLNWFTVGSLYLSFSIVYFMAFESFPTVIEELKYAFNIIYTFLTILQFLMGLGSKANDTHKGYWICSLFYGIIMAIALLLSVWHLLGQSFNFFIVIAAVIAFGSYALGGILHGELFAIVSVVVQYLFMLPTFVNMFIIYSFCNMHDISWGTKEGNLTNEARRAAIANDGISHQLGAIAAAAAAQETPVEKLAQVLGAEKARAALERARENKTDLLSVAALAAKAQEASEKGQKQAEMKAEIAKENKELESIFTGFRTRLVVAWVFSNWTYVTMVTNFGWLEYYAIGVAGAILWTLAYRVAGSILYIGHRAGKWCCRQCMKCCRTYICCCCCSATKKKHKKRKTKYQFENKVVVGNYTGGTGGRAGAGRMAVENVDDWESKQDGAMTSRSRRSRRGSARTSRSRGGTSRGASRGGPSSRGRAKTPAMMDLSDDLVAAGQVSGAIMARKADGSRPTTSRSRATRRSHSGSDTDSGSETGSSYTGSDTESSGDERPRTGRVRTPGRTVSRQAMSYAPLSGVSKRPSNTNTDASSEDAHSRGGRSKRGSMLSDSGSDSGSDTGSRRNSLSNLMV